MGVLHACPHIINLKIKYLNIMAKKFFYIHANNFADTEENNQKKLYDYGFKIFEEYYNICEMEQNNTTLGFHTPEKWYHTIVESKTSSYDVYCLYELKDEFMPQIVKAIKSNFYNNPNLYNLTTPIITDFEDEFGMRLIAIYHKINYN